MKFSLQGDKVAFGSDVLDFDNVTGIISNPVDIGGQGWGRAFSKSERNLHYRRLSAVFQYDLISPNIPASEVQFSAGRELCGGMQIGPDYKIYVSVLNRPYVGVINEPDSAGLACNFVLDQIPFGAGDISLLCLPNFVDSDLNGNEYIGLIEEDLSLNFYPNPSRGYLVFDEAVIMEDLVISSCYGEIIDHLSFNGNTLEVQSLSSGVDFILYKSSSSKFVKQ